MTTDNISVEITAQEHKGEWHALIMIEGDPFDVASRVSAMLGAWKTEKQALAGAKAWTDTLMGGPPQSIMFKVIEGGSDSD
ncbi:MAG: hypothetical protein ACE5FM_05920 [Methyloligellaceae bacterium]